jgi:hypothetical protein
MVAMQFFWHINHMTTSGRNATVLSVLLGDLNLIAESTEYAFKYDMIGLRAREKEGKQNTHKQPIY